MANPKHGHARTRTQGKVSPTYRSYRSMIGRCTNPKFTAYERYGGRGIKICERWLESFTNFLEDMGDRPAGRSLDRINSEGNYEKENCRWADWKQQNNNRRNSEIVDICGYRGTVQSICDVVGIESDTFRRRLKRGWSDDDALLKPVRKQKNNRVKKS